MVLAPTVLPVRASVTVAPLFPSSAACVSIDVALIDIMMPEMDGFQTIREIRRHEHLRDVPLIAVTAKAMKGDRQKCIEAGASDYVAKPVDIDLLLSLLRVWITRSPARSKAANDARQARAPRAVPAGE